MTNQAALLLSSTSSEVARLALAERCRRSLAFFTRMAWHIVEPGEPIIWNWHIDAICQALEAVTRGEVRHLLINIPPGMMKSLLVSVMWPAWEWTFKPGERSLFGSYSIELAMRDSVKCRRIIESDWYRNTFRPDWQLSGDQNVKSFFENTHQGVRMALSVGGPGTGFRGNKVVVDDPLNVKDAESDLKRAEAFRWWTKTMPNRVNNPKKGAFVIVMQRLHEDDLAGHMLRQKRPKYVHLSLPAEYETKVACPCGLNPCSSGVLGKLDPRTEQDELLFQGLLGPEQLGELKDLLGPSAYAGQYQQRPSPAGGQMFKDSWWKFWRLPHQDCPLEYADRCIVLPDKFDRMLQSWDMSFKDKKTSSFVVGQVWAKAKANCFLLDQDRRRRDMPSTIEAVKALTVKWPEATEKLVEAKANGPAVVSTLKGEISGFIEVETGSSDKIARAASVTPVVASGNVFLPLPNYYPWVRDYLHELSSFPNGSNDDQVDDTSQALSALALQKLSAAARLSKAFGGG